MNIEDSLYRFLNLYYHLPQPIASLIGTLYRQLPRSLTMGKRYGEFVELCHELAGDRKLQGDYANREFMRTLKAAEQTPFYASFYAEHGISFSDVKSVADIAILPTVEKQDIKLHFSQMIVPGRERSGLYITTGGSTGTPVGFMLEKGVSRAKEAAFIEQIWSSVDYRQGDRVAIIRGIELPEGRMFRFEPIKNALMLSSYHITERNLDTYIGELNRFRPRYIQAYPSSIYLLARILKHTDRRLDFTPRAILCGSENLYPGHVALVEEVFGTEVLGWYGHAERVLLAVRLKSGAYEFLDGYGIPEIVGEDGRPVSEGTGTLCGTSLNNVVLPLVRYLTDDIATLDGPRGETGSGLVVTSIEGRRHEFVLAYNGRPVSMTAINIHSDEFDVLERFQFVQTEKGKVSFEYTSASELSKKDRQAIEGVLNSKLGNGFDLEILRVENFPLTKNGKQSFLRQEIKTQS